jgi:Alpha/beta hydrolase domain
VALAVVPADSPLLGGLRASFRIAAGESQSAFRLSSYYNSIHPLHRLYDGFLLYDRGGPFPLREDVGTPLIAFGSEFMSEYLGPSQSDSRWLRWWEVAGAAHGSLDEFQHYIDPQVLRDGAMQIDGQVASLSAVLQHQSGDTTTPLWSRVPNGDVLKAALHALRRWITQGQPPASAPRLAMGADGRLLRDAQGRVQGGIRTAAYDVPIAHNLGVTATGCALAGAHLDFSPGELVQRYGTPQVYAQQVARVHATNVAAGFLLEEDAAASLARTRQWAFGKAWP